MQQCRIALWDVSYTLPRLRPALERLNKVQSVFKFEVVDGSVPMGLRAANIAGRGDTREPLDGIQADAKLSHAAAHLGVDLLACIVDQPISDGEDDDLYAFAVHGSRVAFYSVTEFNMKRRAGGTPAELAGNNLKEDRAIAMMACTAACWFLSELGTHQTGPVNCPMYFDDRIEMHFLTKRPHFCRSCRRKFRVTRGKLPPDVVLNALDAVMGAFF